LSGTEDCCTAEAGNKLQHQGGQDNWSESLLMLNIISVTEATCHKPCFMTLTIPSAASFDHVNPFRTSYLNRGNRIFKKKKQIYKLFKCIFFSIIINKKLIDTICSNKSKKQVSDRIIFFIVKKLIYRCY